MKKILVIKGSTRENGYTNSVVKEALEKACGAEVKYFDSYKSSAKPCINCGYCLNNKKCVYNDLDGFFEDFREADIIIFASPVFNGGFPSPLKAVIDRFQFFFNLFYENGKVQPIKKRRKALLLCASGREAKSEFSSMEASLKRAFTILNIELFGSVLLENTDENKDFRKEKDDFTTLLKRSLNDE